MPKETVRPRGWFGLRARHRPVPNLHVLRNFFQDRCTHLAAMIAYYALLSFLPFLFLLLSLVSLTGDPSASSFLVRQLHDVLPGRPVGDIVTIVSELQGNATQLGLIGLVGILWTSLGFLSACESALNIIYEVPNRAFLRQKALVVLIVGTTLATLLAGLVVATTVSVFLQRHKGFVDGRVDLGVIVTGVGTTILSLGFAYVVYRYLPNTRIDAREALPGTISTAVAFQVSFLLLPYYLRLTANLPALQAFGGVVLLLVWFFLMGNILLFGAEVNWWLARGRYALAADRPPKGA